MASGLECSSSLVSQACCVCFNRRWGFAGVLSLVSQLSYTHCACLLASEALWLVARFVKASLGLRSIVRLVAEGIHGHHHRHHVNGLLVVQAIVLHLHLNQEQVLLVLLDLLLLEVDDLLGLQGDLLRG